MYIYNFFEVHTARTCARELYGIPNQYEFCRGVRERRFTFAGATCQDIPPAPGQSNPIFGGAVAATPGVTPEALSALQVRQISRLHSVNNDCKACNRLP